MQQPSISCIESRVENDNSLYGRFLLGPFRVGQGITVANALRRSLLSELTGLAITAIEIDGANHEYSTLRGVRESVLDILTNIKQIILTSAFPVDEPQIGYLEIHGPGIVLAKDIKLPFSIQCVNPEQYIAGLSFDGILRIKIFICKGKNYKSSSSFNENFSVQNKYIEIKKKLNKRKIVKKNHKIETKNYLEIPLKAKQLDIQNSSSKITNKKEYLKPLNYSIKSNFFPYKQIIKKRDNFQEFNKNEKLKRCLLNVNAVFGPVKKVNFLLKTDHELKESRDQIILEVWTNGSLLPRQAINNAVTALIQLFTRFQFLVSPFKNVFDDFSSYIGRKITFFRMHNPLKKLKTSQVLMKQKNIFLLDLANLNLSLQSYIYLKRAGIETVGDLMKLSPKDLLLFKNYGQNSLDQLKEILSKIHTALFSK